MPSTPSEASRHTEQAFAWAEAQIGGKIVRKERQKRWRPAYFLDIELPGGEVRKVMLRGFRGLATGIDDTDSRERLRKEAGVCKAMNEGGCAVAGYHGYEPQGGWFLMDELPGSPYLTRVEDPDRQANLFRQYVDALVYLNKLDYTKLDLPDNLPIAQDAEDAATMMLRTFRMGFDAWPAKPPEPTIALALDWLDKHRPKPADRFSFATGDIGTDQFMFEGDRLTGMFDLEMAYVGDPMQDIGLCRLRDMCYPLPGLPEHLRYWCEQMDREFDRETICYWTIAGMIASPMAAYPLWVAPGDLSMMHHDTLSVHAFIPIHMRGTCEALAEYYGMDLTMPETPEPVLDSYSIYDEWMVKHMDRYYLARDNEWEAEYDFQCTKALAQSVSLARSIGPQLKKQNLEDFSQVLDHPISSEAEGLQLLEARIKEAPERDLDRIIPVLHRYHARHEMICKPIQEFTGFSHLAPMQRAF